MELPVNEDDQTVRTSTNIKKCMKCCTCIDEDDYIMKKVLLSREV